MTEPLKLPNIASPLPIPGTERKEVLVGPPEVSNYLDHVASLMMAALLSEPSQANIDFTAHPDDDDSCDTFYENIAAHAYMAAQALIKERGNQ